MDHPKVISMNVSDKSILLTDKSKSSVKIINKLLNENFKGTVIDNVFVLKPSEHWILEKLSTGVYKITHNIGYLNTSLSVSLLFSPGSFEIKEHSPVYFIIQTTLNQKPKDFDFMFTLSRVVA